MHINFTQLNLFSKWYCNGNTLPHNWNLWSPYVIILVQCNFVMIFKSIIIPVRYHNKFPKLDAMLFFSSKIAPPFEIQHGCSVSEDFGTMNGQWVRVHTLKKGKHKTWHSMYFPYNPINFATFPFLILPPIYSPYTRSSETILTSKTSIERQMNMLSRDIYLMNTNSG